jgi:prepilin-type N-terminal cleavage/methylation domain-containing protein
VIVSRGHRHGFTLIELLVVIAIIGILVALLLPAVQAAREAARRLQCTNNLKQIGIALHHHHKAHETFPYGHRYVSDQPDPNGYEADKNGNEATWITRLLPYVEQENAYDRIDWDRGLGQARDASHPNNFINKLRIPLFECPSNSSVDPWNGARSRASYVANNGFGPMTENTTVDLPMQRDGGVFYLNSDMPLSMIRDGSSNTAALSEIVTVDGSDFRGVMHYPEGPLYHHNQTPGSLAPDHLRGVWFDARFCVSVPEAPCIETFSNWGDRSLIMTARSRHPGGVNLLLCDSSVHFLNNSVDLDVWKALGTPAGGEPTGLPQ